MRSRTVPIRGASYCLRISDNLHVFVTAACDLKEISASLYLRPLRQKDESSWKNESYDPGGIVYDHLLAYIPAQLYVWKV